MHIMNIN